MADLIETIHTMIQNALAEERFLGRVTAVVGTTVSVARPGMLAPDAQPYASAEGLAATLAVNDVVTVQRYGANLVVTGKVAA